MMTDDETRAWYLEMTDFAGGLDFAGRTTFLFYLLAVASQDPHARLMANSWRRYLTGAGR
jgi:hypothetical protein